MANEQNLKSWQPGQSGNPKGKPKGTKHLSTWIQEMMENDSFKIMLSNGKIKKEAPIRATITVLINKALEGDMKAADLLCKYGYGSKINITTRELPTPILEGLYLYNKIPLLEQIDSVTTKHL